MMKTRTCTVSPELPRVDISYDGILFLGAALHGDGGPMGGASAEGWTEIPKRVRVAAGRREMLRIYTVHRAGTAPECFDAPAAACILVAAYAPRYDPRHLQRGGEW